jgi:hypothetical protein
MRVVGPLAPLRDAILRATAPGEGRVVGEQIIRQAEVGEAPRAEPVGDGLVRPMSVAMKGLVARYARRARPPARSPALLVVWLASSSSSSRSRRSVNSRGGDGASH